MAHHTQGKAKVKDLLCLALLDFDMAAIYTIHGFCQRVLTRFAFETRQGFDVEPASDADDEIEQRCRDWWRKNVYAMDKDIAGFLAESGKFSQEAITELATKLIAKPDAVVEGEGSRNGDVETYIKATKTIDSKYDLVVNHRSEARLIDAVNQIFQDQPPAQTFGKSIKFWPSEAPKGEAGAKPKPRLTVNGQPDDKPFKILLIENHSGGKVPGTNSQTAKNAYRLTAREIARILREERPVIGKKTVEPNEIAKKENAKPIEPKDIAVLVSKHDEASRIAEALRALNIPSVRQGTGDVWSTDEGRTLWWMLEAVLDARNASHIRMVLNSPWGGLTPDQILDLNAGNDVPFGKKVTTRCSMEHFVALFADLRNTWQKRGFPAMFRALMAQFDIKVRLLDHADKQGQRRLANLIHLAELIERKIIEDRKTPEGILAWVRRQFGKDTADGGDKTNLRLEYDDNAVQIMTIFTRKGLQFPIVFAPTLFMMKTSNKSNTYEYHDDEGNLLIVQKPDDKKEKEPHQKKEDAEIAQEQVRQIYVALTRGIHRTVVIALDGGAKDGTPIDPLGKLLRLPPSTGGDTLVVYRATHETRFANIPGVTPAVEILDRESTDSESSQTAATPHAPGDDKETGKTTKALNPPLTKLKDEKLQRYGFLEDRRKRARPVSVGLLPEYETAFAMTKSENVILLTRCTCRTPREG